MLGLTVYAYMYMWYKAISIGIDGAADTMGKANISESFDLCSLWGFFSGPDRLRQQILIIIYNEQNNLRVTNYILIFLLHLYLHDPD